MFGFFDYGFYFVIMSDWEFFEKSIFGVDSNDDLLNFLYFK